MRGTMHRQQPPCRECGRGPAVVDSDCRQQGRTFLPLTAPWSYAMVDLMETLDDDDLVRRIGAGGQDAFVALIRRYERSMATVIRAG